MDSYVHSYVAKKTSFNQHCLAQTHSKEEGGVKVWEQDWSHTNQSI